MNINLEVMRQLTRKQNFVFGIILFGKSIYIELFRLHNFLVITFILHKYRSYISFLIKKYTKLRLFDQF